MKQIRYALVLLLTGLVLYFARALYNREWPFGRAVAPVAHGAPTR